MKKIHIIFAASLFLFLGVFATSCSDLLDQKPQGDWTSEDQKGSFESLVFTIYGQARGYNITGGLPPLIVQNIRCEDVDKGSTKSDGDDVTRMFKRFEYTASHGTLKGYWEGNYTVIHSVNKLLASLKEYEEKEGQLNSSAKINKGEAHFFRAFAYFNLVRAFGEVPLVDFKIDQAEDANIPKNTAEEIYKLIDEDLKIAAENLPEAWAKNFSGRLTTNAAKALHARTYMMRSDWENMYDLSKEVINSGLYNLSTPFDKIFREEAENGPESVFELNGTSTEAIPNSNTIGSQYAEVQGVRGSGQWDLGWGWHTPSQKLAEAFEEGDPRKDETLLYFARSAAEAATMEPNKPYGEVPIAQSTVENLYYNKKAYTNPALRAKYHKHGHWFNIRIIRYSDVVLMAAEAANELGNVSEAGQYLEMVRARARGGNDSVLPKRNTSDQNQMREYIRHERRIELAMEWDRFYDLVRWNTAVDVLGPNGYQPKHALLPLPQAEIDKSNGVLVQNPNY